jgi:predicted small lipoprotein YifL
MLPRMLGLFSRISVAARLGGALMVLVTLGACGGSFLPPNDRLATAEAATRSAKELGATQEPNAKLHLQLAEEQIEQARALMKEGDNKAADNKLMRASADAELALMLAKEHAAQVETEQVQEKLRGVKGK